jgi:amidase
VAKLRAAKGLRIGIDPRYALEGLDRGEAAAIEEALRVLADEGARIVEVRVPHLSRMLEAWLTICASEAARAHAATYPSRAEEYGVSFRGVLEMGAGMTSEQLAAATRVRAELASLFTAVLETVDALASAAGGSPAWPVTPQSQVGPAADLRAAWSAAAPRAADFTMPMDLAGTPSICLPSGFSSDGLPYSIQLAGRRLSEPLLCHIAHAYERVTHWHARHPDVEVT